MERVLYSARKSEEEGKEGTTNLLEWEREAGIREQEIKKSGGDRQE